MNLFAQLNWQPLLEDHGIPLAIMGLTVVFAALTLLRIFIGLLPRVMRVLEHYFPEHEETSPAVVLSEATEGKLPDELVAVIAAAVAATIHKPHRILHTRKLTTEELSWSLEGRRQQHGSHRLQPRDPR